MRDLLTQGKGGREGGICKTNFHIIFPTGVDFSASNLSAPYTENDFARIFRRRRWNSYRRNLITTFNLFYFWVGCTSGILKWGGGADGDIIFEVRRSLHENFAQQPRTNKFLKVFIEVGNAEWFKY